MTKGDFAEPDFQLMMEESSHNVETNVGDDLLSSIEESLSRAHSAHGQDNDYFFPDTMTSTLPNSSDATEEKLV